MVKKLIAVALLCSGMMASDIMTLYRAGGMKAIEKEIDKGLSDSTYWSEIISGKDLRFGYFENTDTVLACSKDKSTLELYTRNAQEQFALKKSYSAFTGKYDGDKIAEGDRRTPIGVYTLIQKINNVDPFYGPMAFVTSYPNLYDRIRGKNGSGIWIHGVPLNGSRDSFTKGCIAIDNEDLLSLDREINPKNAVVIIDKHIRTQADRSIYPSIMASLFKWRYAWTYNDLETYLSFYDPSFERYDGMNLSNFKSYKEKVFAKNESKSIEFKNINIIPYPGEKPNLFMVTFDETYISDNHTFQGSKVLMVTLNTNKTISILSEQ